MEKEEVLKRLRSTSLSDLEIIDLIRKSEIESKAIGLKKSSLCIELIQYQSLSRSIREMLWKNYCTELLSFQVLSPEEIELYGFSSVNNLYFSVTYQNLSYFIEYEPDKLIKALLLVSKGTLEEGSVGYYLSLRQEVSKEFITRAVSKGVSKKLFSINKRDLSVDNLKREGFEVINGGKCFVSYCAAVGDDFRKEASLNPELICRKAIYLLPSPYKFDLVYLPSVYTGFKIICTTRGSYFENYNGNWWIISGPCSVMSVEGMFRLGKFCNE